MKYSKKKGTLLMNRMIILIFSLAGIYNLFNVNNMFSWIINLLGVLGFLLLLLKSIGKGCDNETKRK